MTPDSSHLLRNALSRLKSREDVAVAILLVEDQPRRDVLAGTGPLAVLAAVHVVARLDVGHRLVHESLARHVHDDRARRVAFRQREPWCADQRHRRPPPGVLHDVQCGAELLARDDAVAGVGLGADRPLGGDRGALVLHPHLLVVLEPARAEDHAAAGPDQFGLSRFGCVGIADIDAAHHAVLDIQVGERRVQPHRHPGLLQADPQRRDQRTAHADEVLAGRLGPHGAGADLEAAQHSARMALEHVQPHVILLHHNDIERDLAVRRLEARLVGAEFLGVEGLGLDRATARPAAGGLGVVVGVTGHPAHLQWGVLQHEGQHLRAAVEIGVDALRRDDVADDAVQVCPRRVGRVGDAVALEDFVVRDPHSTARSGSGSAVVCGLFYD